MIIQRFLVRKEGKESRSKQLQRLMKLRNPRVVFGSKVVFWKKLVEMKLGLLISPN